MKFIISVIIFLMIIGSNVFAITPFVTEEAYTLPYGWALEFETRFFSYKDNTDRVNVYRFNINPTFSLRENLDFLMYIPIESFDYKEKSGTNSGIGDIRADIKYLISKELPQRPAVSLNLELKFGLADKDKLPSRGTEKEDLRLYFAISKVLNKKTEIDFNLGFTKKGTSWEDDVIDFSAALTNPINKYNYYLLEIYGNTKANPHEDSDPISAFLGFRHITVRNSEINIGSSIGITSAAPDFNAVISLNNVF